MTKRQSYEQAILALETACAEFDQAHASLIECNCEDVDARHGYFGFRINALSNMAGTYLKALKAAECPTCWHPISSHEVMLGCQRGDRDDADGVATGPCSCMEWS